MHHSKTDGESIYIPINKNGSTSHQAMFQVAGWGPVDLLTFTQLPAYVVVRDPVARWFSGVAQVAYQSGFDDFSYLLDEVREGRSPVFGEFTNPQIDYLPPTVPNRTLVRLEDAAEYVLKRWGLVLPHKNLRGPRRHDPDLVPMLEDFYADDLALYRGAASPPPNPEKGECLTHQDA